MVIIQKFKLLYNKWGPTTKLMFWLAIISIFVGLVFGGNYTFNKIYINQETKSVYVSPAKKLIKADMADYSFPLKIINEKAEDFNNMGLIYSVPEDYGIYRVMIKPEDETERISKYNNSLQIMLPCFGWPEDNKYIGVCFIESIYKLEIKEYEITIDTRGYKNDFFIEFGLINLSQQPKIEEIFKGFGTE